MFFFALSCTLLKLQSVTCTSLSPSVFENLELQFLAELSSVRGVVIRCSGTAPARMNLMFWGECVVVSHGIAFHSHVFHKHIILSGLQSAIKMIYFIILAAVRKGYKRSTTCSICMCVSLLARTTSLCLQTWRNVRISRKNLPVQLKLENIIIS